VIEAVRGKAAAGLRALLRCDAPRRASLWSRA